MPNAAGMIYESIWRDGDWRKLSRSAQGLYMQLLSQKELDCAGILPLQPAKWAKGCDELTVDQVWADLNELQDNRFVFYDVDTDETLIRTHIHKPFIINIPNCRASALRAAKLCASPFLRTILAEELRAVGRPEFTETAEQINPTDTVTQPYPNPIGTVSEPYPNPIENIGLPNPIDTVPIPTGMGTGTGNQPLGLTQGGRATPRPHCSTHPNGNPDDTPCRGCAAGRHWDTEHRQTPDPTTNEPTTEPPRYCPRHPAGTDTECRACGDARRTRDTWQRTANERAAERARHEADQRRQAAHTAAQAIHDCPLCDQDGYRHPDHRTVCDHTDRTNTTRRGLAAARAALNTKPQPAAG